MSKTKTSPSTGRATDVRKAGAATTGCVILLGLFLVGFVLAVIVMGLNLMGVLGSQPIIAGSGEAVDQTGLAQRDNAEARLNSYGWVDEEAGLVRIPVEQAMAEIAEAGLPVGTAGLETPTPEIPTPTPTPEPQVEAETPGEGTAAAEEPPATPTVDLTNVSFQDHVLPIFEERCAQCHGGEDSDGEQRIEEGLILLSYEDILNGSWNGSVIEPGSVEDSYLIEQIVTGRMPKEGERVPPDQIEIIEAWVAAGAPNN